MTYTVTALDSSSNGPWYEVTSLREAKRIARKCRDHYHVAVRIYRGKTRITANGPTPLVLYYWHRDPTGGWYRAEPASWET